MGEGTVEGFLWHPLCITMEPTNPEIALNDTYIISRGDGSMAEDGESTGLTVLLPPRATSRNDDTTVLAVKSWAQHRRMTILKKHHAVIDG